MEIKLKKTVIILLLACVSCSNLTNVYTLYRSSVIYPNARIHVATFDSKDGADYNQENCETARNLFQSQEGVKTKFWCEKGSFKEWKK